MSPRATPAVVRFYVDADVLGLAGSAAIGTWAQLEVLLCQWRAIERTLDQPGPFIYSALRTSLRPVPPR